MISVIMLTYNREKFLSRMVEDLLSQTYRDFELIIIDNGSTDNSGNIVDIYSKKDDRVKAFHLEKPKSIGYARNYGVGKSNGDYVAFVDDDDRIGTDYLEFLINLLEENKADISICGCSEGSEDMSDRRPQCIFDEKMTVSGVEAVDYLLGRKYIRAGMPGKLYKSDIVKKFPFVENYKNEDVHTQYKYLLEGKKIAMHGIDKYYFTRHGGNVSEFTSDASRWNKEIMSGYLDAYVERTRYIKVNAPEIYGKALYSKWSFMISMIDKIKKYSLTDCEDLRIEMTMELKTNREEFLKMNDIKDFEIEWMEKYI